MTAAPRYLGLITGASCGALVSTVILSGKIAAVGGATFPASIVLFPLTFLIGKRQERIDHFDVGTDFSPFRLKR